LSITKYSKQLISLFLLVFLWIVSCTPQSTTSSPPLRIGSGIWPGIAGDYVAADRGFFAQEKVQAEEILLPTLTENITAFLSGKSDIMYGTSADAVQLQQEDPSIKTFYLADYSNGGDGIVARNIKNPVDLKGKTIARENLLFTNVFLRAYLQQAGLTEKDVVLRDMSSADAAAAYVAKRVDVAVTNGPWLANAVKSGGGGILFTSKDTNLVADVILAREQVLQSRKTALVN
jgi:NitT/TauT family transport system substrate-binding protein